MIDQSLAAGGLSESQPPVSFLSVKRAAAALGVHYQTVYRWVKQGAIPNVKTPGGRIRIPLSWVKAQKWVGQPIQVEDC